MKEDEFYNDFLEDHNIPKSDRFFCRSCERWVPKANNGIHTCYDAKELRKNEKKGKEKSYLPYCPECESCGEAGCCTPLRCAYVNMVEKGIGKYCEGYYKDIKFAYKLMEAYDKKYGKTNKNLFDKIYDEVYEEKMKGEVLNERSL